MDKRLIIPTLAFLALPLAACGADETTPEAAAPAPSSSASAQAPAAALTVTDPWVKIVDKGMTAAFGTLRNSSSADVTVTSAATPASATVELHEVVNDADETKMRPKDGGFVVPAGGSLELKPGGFHIMLMDVKEPLQAGSEVAFTLTLSDGSEIEFKALAKEFNGGNENYEGGGH